MIRIHNVYEDISLTAEKSLPFVHATFPGGEAHVVVQPDQIAGHYIWVDARVADAEEFMGLVVLLDAIRGCDPARVGLFLPYFPGARQDRRSPDGSALTVSVYARMLAGSRLDYLLVADPHSDVTLAVLEPVWRDGTFLRRQSFREVRETLWPA